MTKILFSSFIYYTYIRPPPTSYKYYTSKILSYIADLPLALASAQTSSKSDNIPARSFTLLTHRPVRFQLTSPLAFTIAKLYGASLFFNSLLPRSWDARLTSRITDIQWHIYYFPPPNKHSLTKHRCMKMCINNSTFIWT